MESRPIPVKSPQSSKQPSQPLARQAVAAVVAQNMAVLRQGLEVVRRLDTERFCRAPRDLAVSGAGAHFRHIFDYYRCFLRDRESGRIDYDLRERDERFEREPKYAAKRMERVIGELSAWLDANPEGLDGERAVRIRVDAPEGLGESAWTPSTVGRELTQLLSHTIHHFALIALILKLEGVDCGSEFGVAPSTLAYWKERDACAPSVGLKA